MTSTRSYYVLKNLKESLAPFYDSRFINTVATLKEGAVVNAFNKMSDCMKSK